MGRWPSSTASAARTPRFVVLAGQGQRAPRPVVGRAHRGLEPDRHTGGGDTSGELGVLAHPDRVVELTHDVEHRPFERQPVRPGMGDDRSGAPTGQAPGEQGDVGRPAAGRHGGAATMAPATTGRPARSAWRRAATQPGSARQSAANATTGAEVARSPTLRAPPAKSRFGDHTTSTSGWVTERTSTDRSPSPEATTTTSMLPAGSRRA